MKKILLVLSCVLFMSCESPIDDIMENENVVFYDTIWSNGMFNSFTDLIEFDGKYYCCFREGVGHILFGTNQYGKIKVISSNDGISWDEVCTIYNKDYDLRDPHMSITPDNKLMINFGCSVYENGETVSKKSQVCFLSAEDLRKGEIEILSKDINLLNFGSIKSIWLWKVTWIEGTAYGVVYGNSGPILVSSSDGINFSIIAKLNVHGGETDLCFYSDGRMFLFNRATYVNGYYCESAPPYTEFEWHESPYFIQCPDILRINDKSFLIAGRGGSGTAIFILKSGKMEQILDIAGEGGDCAYPGMIRVNNEIWMTYYCSYYLNDKWVSDINIVKYDISDYL